MRSHRADGLCEHCHVEEHGSRGEKQLARMFLHYNIRYFYEHPLGVIDRGKVRLYYVDFWLPEYATAVEYAGMATTETGRAGMEHKKTVYEESGIDCLWVLPDDLNGFWPKQVLGELRAISTRRLARLENVIGVTD